MINYLERPGLPRLAYQLDPGCQPTLVFLHGFMSDMGGTKAEMLADWCRARGLGFLRFDLQGHGQSGGDMRSATMSRWRQDVLDLLDQVTSGQLILVGSSMGGWLALLAALARPEQVKALTLIAPAPDFTSWSVWDRFDAETQSQIEQQGFITLPSAYGPDPLIITHDLITDGRQHTLLNAPIAIDCPVRVLHGQQDPDVPWQQSLTLAERLTSADVQLLFIKDGDHRLSRDSDLGLLGATLEGLLR
jgi:pimeloyl-ACP methyl ester carboxylesterase